MGPRNLVLIGLMGAGKSHVGRQVAAHLDRPFVDTDSFIERRTGMSIPQLFATHGEAAFRENEARAVALAAATTGQVISVGGGAVLDPRNVAGLARTGVLVWLHADPATLARRLEHSIARGARPLLTEAADTHARLRQLLEERQDAYEAAAHHVVRTDALTVDETVTAVLAWVRAQRCLEPAAGIRT